MPDFEGRVLSPDWCLTCQGWVDRLNDHATHDVLCEPPNGWDSCSCRHCRRAVAQMAPARGLSSDGEADDA